MSSGQESERKETLKRLSQVRSGCRLLAMGLLAAGRRYGAAAI